MDGLDNWTRGLDIVENDLRRMHPEAVTPRIFAEYQQSMLEMIAVQRQAIELVRTVRTPVVLPRTNGGVVAAVTIAAFGIGMAFGLFLGVVV